MVTYGSIYSRALQNMPCAIQHGQQMPTLANSRLH